MNPLGSFYTLRSYVESYAGLIGRRFISVIWVVAICVVIWLYGYLLGYGNFKPLAATNPRLVAIGAVIAIWLVYLLVSTLRARKRDKALIEGIENDMASDAASQQAEIGEIHGRLKEALSLLRRITKKRFGYVYELPWYVIFGAPGSGKTTALTNSGLTFPLGDALGSSSIQGAGGTRNCNWWFADQAILIDTAGRYTTQDDLNGASKAGWEGFLGLLRKYRRSQPVNGALVTLSIGDLLTRDHEAQLEEVRAIRKRLSELDEFLQARVPVYIVLTKADLLTGFVEFFDGLNKTDREQVWGATFGLDESYKGGNLPNRFMEEFALLQERVGSMLIERLQQEPNTEVRGKIFRFPAELASLKERLHEVLTDLCSASALVEAPLMRGVYFASSTQPQASAARGTVQRARRSYFLTRLFKEVIFDEASLVARDRRLSRRQMIIRRTAYGLAAVVLAVVFAGWTATYFQNSRAIAAADQRIDDYERLARGIPVRDVSDADFLRVLPALDNLRAVNSAFSQPGAWPVSFGLDQGDKITSRQRDAYQRALNALLLPRMLVELQKEMNASSDVGKTFDALKLYGMLGGLGPMEPQFVAQQANEMFASLYPDEGRAAARQALLTHAEAMASGVLPAIELDRALITKAQDTIRSQSLAARAYDILDRSRRARTLDPWVPADALGALGAQAFERKTNAPLRDGIPGIYTGKGYHSVVLPMVTEAAREALSEQWVRGSGSNPSGMTTDVVAQAALQLYFDDFQRLWSTLLGDIRVRPSETLSDATETTRALATDPTPIEAIAKSVSAATDLRGPGEAEVASAGDAAEATSAMASAANAPDPYGPLRDALKARSEAAQPGADAADKTSDQPRSQIAALQPILQNVYNQLSRASTSTAEVARVFDASGQLTSANQDLLQEARQLPAPVDAWMASVSADIGALAVKTARSRINDLWATEGANLCTGAVTGRYPFDRASSQDMAMADFVRLFGPEGVFQTFFKNRLEAFVDTSAQPWGWRGTFGGDSIASPALAQFQNADRIYHAFFPAGSEKPAIAINIRPVSLTDSANAVMMEMEGERVVYFHGPIQEKSITWPSVGAENQSRIAFQPGGWQEAMTENGDWSPFRLFDAAKVTVEGPDRFRAHFDNHGQSAEFDVQFGSVLSPFRLPALSDFSCPSQF